MTCFEFRIAPRCSALACARTFAWREVFFPTHMSPEKTDSDLFRRCGDETHEASILYPSIARWEGFFPSHRFLFCVVNWNWTFVLGDCFALRREVLSKKGKYLKFSGVDIPRPPFSETLCLKYVFICGKEYLAAPLYFFPRASRPALSESLKYCIELSLQVRRNQGAFQLQRNNL